MTTSELGGSLRPIRRDEIPECVRVIRESFMTVAREFGYTKEKSPLFTGYLISEERLYRQFDYEKRPMLCYELGGKIVGYYSLAMPKNGVCEINNLAVLPNFRHLGIGELMVRDAIERMRQAGCKAAFVDIVDENLRLRSWYERLGFRYEKTVRLDGYEFLNSYMLKEL